MEWYGECDLLFTFGLERKELPCVRGTKVNKGADEGSGSANDTSDGGNVQLRHAIDEGDGAKK